MKNFLMQAAMVKPSKRQLDWFELGGYAFIHFGINTFTDREWGNGKEDEKLFDPQKLDCDQWVAAIKSAGLKGMVLTAKHHDGFCLWPSKYTEHSVKNSMYSGDVVREASDACRRGGIKFGFYLSPWDRNSALYGTPEYNDYFCNQLTELLTEYGDIFCVWFDNACGEGPNGKRQVYDFDRYISLIRKYQPGAVIFNDYGPDVRWCGNEGGHARHSEWAVVPRELCRYSEVQTVPSPMAEYGDLSYMYNMDEEIGTLSNIMFSRGLCFTPSEINMSIRPGWFFHDNEGPHSLERLYRTWLTSYGANACMHLNIPPNKDGLFDERDVARLGELGALLKKEFGEPIVSCENSSSPECGELCAIEGCSEYQPKYKVHLPKPVGQNRLRHIVLREQISEGQRIESFKVKACYENGRCYSIYEGTCVGNRRICEVRDPFAEQNYLTDDREGTRITDIVVQITSSRGPVKLKSITVY
ncbi:MAG: alpha-fucosidase [Ruminococcaceae bacterium]|nr:alpha-fucosidase [Oscillospiraceae bacterium]